MGRLLGAIETAFNQDAGMQQAGLTPLRARRAAREQQFPFVVLFPVSKSVAVRSSTNVYYHQTVQFSAFGNSLEQVDGFEDLLQACFPDSIELTTDTPEGTQVLQMRWLTSNLIEDDSGRHSQVWHAQTDFEATLTVPRQ